MNRLKCCSPRNICASAAQKTCILQRVLKIRQKPGLKTITHTHTQSANLLHKHNFETDTRLPSPATAPASALSLSLLYVGTSWKSREQIAGNPRKWLRTTGGISKTEMESERETESDTKSERQWVGRGGRGSYLLARPHIIFARSENFCTAPANPPRRTYRILRDTLTQWRARHKSSEETGSAKAENLRPKFRRPPKKKSHTQIYIYKEPTADLRNLSWRLDLCFCDASRNKHTHREGERELGRR